MNSTRTVELKKSRSGLYPLLSKIMTNFLGEKAKDIKIISNDGEVEGRNWKIKYRDDS